MKIELLYMGHSHTDTLYAVLVPADDVVYAADTLGVGVFLPVGGVALYTPGYFRALDRLAALDFRTFVGSHFGWGSKNDFLAAAQVQRDIRDWVRSAVRRHAGPIPAFQDRDRLLAIYDEVFAQMKERYGALHGFDTQAFFAFVSGFVNEYVGN